MEIWKEFYILICESRLTNTFKLTNLNINSQQKNPHKSFKLILLKYPFKLQKGTFYIS